MKKLFPLYVIISLLFYTCKVDNTQKVFNSIEVSAENHSFAFMLASNQNYFSTLAQQDHFNKVFSNQVLTVDASKVDGFIAFPDAPSILNNGAATAIKSLYDANGDNSFTFYPNVYEGLSSYSALYTDWKNAMKNTYNSSSKCSIGTKAENFGSKVNIYVKTELSANIDSNINIAVFVVKESIVAPQDTNISTSNPNYIHYHVLMDKLGDLDYGKPCDNKKAGDLNNQSFTYTVPEGVDRNTLKFVAVVFEMHSGIPKKVLNCRTIKL